MNAETPDKEESQGGTAKTKLCGVILLTDNREMGCGERGGQENFRCSGFKQTEVDPLQFQKNQLAASAQEQLLGQLSRRVGDLEERVRALVQLSGLENAPVHSEEARQKKKNRRRFTELVRDHECKHCGKRYGSDTSLKHHLKIKHAPKPEVDSEEEEA